MEEKTKTSCLVRLSTLTLGLALAPLSAQADLPAVPFPLGRADLVETRTVKELRPGLTHVRVERKGKEPPPKIAFSTDLVLKKDRASLNYFRDGFEKAGYTVREEGFQLTPDSDRYTALLAGEMGSYEEAELVLEKLNLPFHPRTVNPAMYPYWEGGPYILDIVIVNPKKYQGKIVSAWAERPWRASPMELAMRDDAVVAINGSWFEYSLDDFGGVPSGISIVQGKWHHEPNTRAQAIYIENHPDGNITLSISKTPPPLPEIKWSGGANIEIDGIDRAPKNNEIVIMPLSMQSSSALSHGAFARRGGVGYQIRSNGVLKDGYTSTGGLMLLATGDKRETLRQMLGHQVEVDLSVQGRPGLNAFYTPHIFFQNGEPGFEFSKTLPGPGRLFRSERTVIGSDNDGNIYLIVSTGPQSGDVATSGTMGTSDVESYQIAQFLGLTNAVNLDGGGGSTSMVIEGKAVDNPSLNVATETRRVADSILVIDDK